MSETKGKRVIAEIGGKRVTLYSIGVLAHAIGRSPITVRKWENGGLLPRPFVEVSDHECRRFRWYTAEMIAAIRQVALQEGFGKRRPSGLFWRHRQLLCDAFDHALVSIDHRVTE